jgi:serine/threonine protein kinase
LKVIGPEFPASPEELQQFARTIRKVAAIHEPHLVPWYAAGRTARYVWISQEYNEGESLDQVLKRGQTASTMLKWRNALKLATDLAKALDLLHKRHIIHGNLTPANVLIGLDRTAKLNDTMYEEALSGSKWQTSRLEKKLLAELPYRAPERLEEGSYWDAAADIYSLGALTYTRLVSVPPFQGKTPGDIIDAIQQGKLVKPRDIIRGCPEQFEAIVLKMLAHNQEDRYEKPEQLLNDLEGVSTL